MGSPVALYFEVWSGHGWEEQVSLRDMLAWAMFLDVLAEAERTSVLLQRGLPLDVSATVMRAIRERRALGDGWGESESWCTLSDLQRTSFYRPAPRRLLLGPLWFRDWHSRGSLRGSPAGTDEETETYLARLGARLVSNDEMIAYVHANHAEFEGRDDGECKVFTIVDDPMPRTRADDVYFADVLKKMGTLGPADAVRLVWSVGPP